MKKITYRDTTHKLVYGHEGWMEDYVGHYHVNDPIMASLKWGHNCQTDGLVNPEWMTYSVCQPDGSIVEAKAELCEGDTIDLTLYDTPLEGFYTFIADYDNCWAHYNDGKDDADWKMGDRSQYPDAVKVGRYRQYTSFIVPVGHFHENAMYQIPSMEISILPTTGTNYEATHEIKFQLMVQGKATGNHPVTLVHLTDNGTVETELTTDAEGYVTICPEVAGTYCMIARAKIPDVVEGKYEEIAYTITHGFRVTGHNHDHHDHDHHDHHEHDHHDHDHHEHGHHEHGHCGCGGHDHGHHHHH